MTDLSNTVALVTGCTGGLGRGISELLFQSGATVYGGDLPDEEADSVKAWKASVSGGIYLPLDVTDAAAWKRVVQHIGQDHGALDILVHNAGVVVVKKLEDTTPEDLRRINGVNSEALLIGTGAALPLLTEGGKRRETGASVITISSTAGLIGAPLHVAYCTSKGAARLFSKACAIEFSARKLNIRCNSVHPGGIDTPMVDHIMQRFAEEGFAPAAADAKSATAAEIPLGRLAQPLDIALAVRFLASEDSRYLHGSEMLVDGGYVAK